VFRKHGTGGAFLDSDHGARLNRDLRDGDASVVQYYLTAASFLIFGENTFCRALSLRDRWLDVDLIRLFFLFGDFSEAG